MNRVLDRLYVGDSSDLDHRVPLRALGFIAVVDLRDASNKTSRDDIAVHLVPNRDGDAWSEADVEGIFKFIHDTIQRGRVLVACAAGQSRSVSVVIGYLVRCGWDLPSAWRVVKEARPQAAPVKVMLDAVLRVSTARENRDVELELRKLARDTISRSRAKDALKRGAVK